MDLSLISVISELIFLMRLLRVLIYDYLCIIKAMYKLIEDNFQKSNIQIDLILFIHFITYNLEFEIYN